MGFIFSAIFFVILAIIALWSLLTRFIINKILKKVFDRKLKIYSIIFEYFPFSYLPIINGNKRVYIYDYLDAEYFFIDLLRFEDQKHIVRAIARKRDKKNKFLKNTIKFYESIVHDMKDEFFVRVKNENFLAHEPKELLYEVVVFIDETTLHDTKLCESYEFIKKFSQINENVEFKFYSSYYKLDFKNQISKGYFALCEKVNSKILLNEEVPEVLDQFLFSIKNSKYNYYNKIFDKDEILSDYQNVRRMIFEESFKKNYFLNNEKIYLEVGNDLKSLVKEQFQVTLFKDKAFQIETFLTKKDDCLILEGYVPKEDSQVKKIAFNFKNLSFDIKWKEYKDK
ncbi:hypothetical protein [Arcobacter sp. CECT 8985]|uniref:hypothetical protein n=1 Tax=Arcobacter sp. CECT 8985 TaxID=1935424 RepID=UPI00100B2C8E|nr:hypothetical protein [Arcobacter sp. CECT 8985]RXJ86475.1 hypothetical protein CRU93_08655 [Arcobacter sp. CECT 8985]